MKILVTGGCGFIGANLIRKLIENGYEVRVLDNLSRGSIRNIEGLNIEFVEGDIRELPTVEKSLKTIDVVIHLAAYGSVVESVSDPVPNFENNVIGTLNMLIGARNASTRKFIFSSTGGAIIGNTVPPVNESSLPKPISPYGSSKLCCEAYINSFSHSYGLNTTMLRFANVYGPFSDHKIGAVTAFIKAILSGKPINIYGDGSASRDLIYVDDLCRGIMLAMEKELPAASVLHIASGIETRIKELAHTIIEVSGGKNHGIIYHTARPGEVTRNFSSYEKAKQIIGFEPQINLKKGLNSTWDWFKTNLS
jgi:UDP-glucose 4-epimerase